MHYTLWISQHCNHDLLTFESSVASSSLQWACDDITGAMGAGTVGNHGVYISWPAFVVILFRHMMHQCLEWEVGDMGRCGSHGEGRRDKATTNTLQRNTSLMTLACASSIHYWGRMLCI